MSVNEVTVAVVSFHPTAIAFKLPAVCAAPYFTVTDAESTCGVAYATCTNLMAAVRSGQPPPPGPVFTGFTGSPPQASNAVVAQAARPERKFHALVERRAGLVQTCILVLPQELARTLW